MDNRDKVIDELHECLELLDCIGSREDCKRYITVALSYIKGQPEIIRCEECDSYMPEIKMCTSWGSWSEENGFCFKGERISI